MFHYGILRVNVLKKHRDSLKLIHLVPPAFVVFIILLTILSVLSSHLFDILVFFMGVYFIIGFVFATLKTFKKGKLLFPFIPFIIFLLHFSWGFGFIVGYFLPNHRAK